VLEARNAAQHGRVIDREAARRDLSDKPQWFVELSPLGKVPLLRVKRDVIFESAVILEYLEDTHAPALHPADPMVRAQHRAWIEFGSSVRRLGVYVAPHAQVRCHGGGAA